ncbi:MULTISPECIES: Rrf2 family transcriptional regulator [unclassified Gemella]|uniref:Rrf2 family transcriptional regulator n=1 Tax=unclassified Gemella TaxID=2624949 RepID=UPI001C04A306|nr:MULTISPECIES: Rrf2 family transcriptional regulator [unclassified Gemella]MBU0279264.1 Rrf2 family transcriptional regulator [Gemella sp. zg-1178]QWQ38769.1 Rrf2 family transcriptional regulator [Gemella sp. zg-570]
MDTRFSVALHILLYISETKNVASSELLATSVNTNSSHIRKIIALLKQAGLIESSQGKSGFSLSKDVKDISLAVIYNSIYQDKKILNIHGQANIECPVGANIKDVLDPVFESSERAFIKELESKTLHQLIEDLYKIGEKNESSNTH